MKVCTISDSSTMIGQRPDPMACIPTPHAHHISGEVTQILMCLRPPQEDTKL